MTPATPDDAELISSTWNAKANSTGSCWSGVSEATPQLVTNLMAAGFHFVIEGNTFGVWREKQGKAEMIGLASQDAITFYALLAAHCDWGLNLGLTEGTAIMAPTNCERTYVDALNAVSFEPALTDAETGEVLQVLASYTLQELRDAIG